MNAKHGVFSRKSLLEFLAFKHEIGLTKIEYPLYAYVAIKCSLSFGLYKFMLTNIGEMWWDVVVIVMQGCGVIWYSTREKD